jgi:hypothetical protein
MDKIVLDGNILAKAAPPTDGGGFRNIYHNWTNSILQQLKRNFGKLHMHCSEFHE